HLAELAGSLDYFRLKDRIGTQITDSGPTITSAMLNGKRKYVSTYAGEVPEALRDFEAKIDAVVEGVNDWKKGRPDPPQVTLHLKQATFLTAVQKLFAQAETRYYFDPEAAQFVVNDCAYCKVNLDLRAVPFSQALGQLMCRSGMISYLNCRESAGITYQPTYD